MTSEICLMNRLAVAMAADSATTVTQWVDGQSQERYFKGANKIFQLSVVQPVGLMIFDNASIHRVPWEIVAKDFRRHLKEDSFASIPEYANELFKFIKSHHRLFPPSYQEEIFRDDSLNIAHRYLWWARNDGAFKIASDEQGRSAAIAEYLKTTLANIDSIPLPKHFTDADVTNALTAHKGAIQEKFRADVEALSLDFTVNAEALSEIAIKAVFKHYKYFLSSTGLVFAGYGEVEYFPSFHEYQCFGLILGNLIVDERRSQAVDHNTPSQIRPFATTDMVDTFSLGFSPDVFASVQLQLRNCLVNFVEKVKANIGGAEIPDIDATIAGMVKEHTDNWTRAALEKHTWPLQRVIGALPVDEMADLAETLIHIQSLKEKVTKPTESVGGPIDVAVITKGDGFIWIKRKHYFDPKLNPRFFQRR